MVDKNTDQGKLLSICLMFVSLSRFSMLSIREGPKGLLLENGYNIFIIIRFIRFIERFFQYMHVCLKV